MRKNNEKLQEYTRMFLKKNKQMKKKGYGRDKYKNDSQE